MSVVLPEVNTTENFKTSAQVLQQAGSQMLSVVWEQMAPAPILPDVHPGWVVSRLGKRPPREGAAIEEIVEDFLTTILPASMKSSAAGNLSYIPVSIEKAGWLGATLALSLNQTRALFRMSPAATEVEEVVLSWLRQMLGLPAPLFGMIHHNSAVLQALVAAREAASDLSIKKDGMARARMRLYVSEQTHVSVRKAALVSGIGEEGIRTIGTDEAFAMIPSHLEEAMSEDREAGWLPLAVVATLGTTSTGSIDPVGAIAELCERDGIWLHVDAAFGGLVGLLPEKRGLLAGWERADSLTLNPHKWLGVPLSCSVLFTRRQQAFKSAFGLVSDYLHDSDANNLADYTDTLPHGFPSLALWMQIRAMGQEGLAHRIRTHLSLAQRFSAWIDQTPGLERMAPTALQIVCFRFHPHGMDEEQLEAYNQQALNTINATGQLALSSTRLKGRLVLRAAFGAMQTDASILSLLRQELLHALGETTYESSAKGASTGKEGVG